MNFNMELIGFKDGIITKIEKIGGQIALYLEVSKKTHICPSCLNTTTKIHDYRIQKIKHLKLFERLTILYYKRRRYSCSCGKRFAENKFAYQKDFGIFMCRSPLIFRQGFVPDSFCIMILF